ncbi:E3 SUMO-protein ligase NSE2-like [Antedon mediterranea]|uniref:E3 SUMO-protein ligase NSE2-like n=1 Tax=Antedon mediterranea TaxID=105859 RepID=UPI003AF5BB5A
MSSQAHFAVLDSTMSQLNRTKEMIPSGMQNTIEVALDLVEYDGKSEQLKEMENTMLEMIALERSLDQFKQAVDTVRQQVANDSNIGSSEVSVIKMLESTVKELEAEDNKTPLEEHDHYQDMQKQIWQVQNPGSVYQPSQSETEFEDSQEFVMTQMEISLKCPITQSEMTEPMKNKHCGHSYEKAAISNYIRTSRRKVMCPVCGCGNQNPLKMEDLNEDKELRLMIQRKNRHRVP